MSDESFDFFGQWLYAGEKFLAVFEGEEDSMAGSHILNNGIPKSMRCLCVSMPFGANLKAWKDNPDFLEKFDRVTFVPDQDEAGSAILEELASLYPGVLICGSMSEKDANAMLLEKKDAEFLRAYSQAAKYRPPAIVDINEYIPLLDEFVPMGLSYPWQNLTNDTYGMVAHQIVSVGSGPGVGKSSVVRAIQQHLMFHHKLKCGIFSLEDSTEQALRYLVGYMLNQRIHIPGSTYDKDLVMKTALSLRDRAYFFDNRFFQGEFRAIEEAMRYLYSEGVNYFFIDPVSALAAHLSSSDANTFINTIMIEMSRLIQEIPIYIMLVNHLNNPTSGPAHDEGGRVLASQFTGAKGQWRYSTDIWGFERDILNEDDTIKNTMFVRNLKHRSDGSKTGRVSVLNYNKDTGRLEEKSSNFDPGFSNVGPSPDTTYDDPGDETTVPMEADEEPKSEQTLGSLIGD